MSAYKDKDFNDRLGAAAKAKQALLDKFRSQPGPDDPAVIAREVERKAISEARESRLAERKVAREAEEARMKAEAELQAAEQAAREAAEQIEAAARKVAMEAEQKAARDARYAARKARGKKKR
jgi:hypothetical protein